MINENYNEYGEIVLGISSCLLGEGVRYDGGHKKDNYITGTLAKYFTFEAVCPELAIGMGVPRPTIRLVKVGEETRVLGVKDNSIDVTDLLKEYGNTIAQEKHYLCGYIFKKDSPSCGAYRVKTYHTNGMPLTTDQGAFAKRFMEQNPLIPVEEEGRLGDAKLRENFIQRVFLMKRWQLMVKNSTNGNPGIRDLQAFHARHKLLIMSYDQNVMRELGKIAADDADANSYIELLMKVMSTPPKLSNHVNVLQHLSGYLKKSLDKTDKKLLGDSIREYQEGIVPLIVPITLFNYLFTKFPNDYVREQYYLRPHPKELKLRNLL